MNNIFDVHAHYDDKWFDDDRDILLSKMQKDGVSFIVNGSVDLESMKKCEEYVNKYEYIYATAGYHPENLESLPDNYLDIVKEYMGKDKFVAIGEIGLDYHWDIDKELQKRVFKEQLLLSKELDVPVVIHDREAHLDTLNLIKEIRPRGILHCYSGSAEMLKEVLKLGMSISMGGVVTFKNARVAVEVIKEVPLDRLLLETDSPYLSPLRGERNDSRNIKFIAEKIADIKDIGIQELIDITTENAKRMFKIN